MSRSNRPFKRPRKSGNPNYDGGASYHDVIPIAVPEEDYSVLHSSEGRLRRIGNDLRTAPMEKTPHLIAGIWESIESWVTPDDTEYALNADGDWYDEVVEQNIDTLEDARTGSAPLTATKTKKVKSLVSRRPHVVWRDSYRQVYLDEVTRWAGRGDFRASQRCPDCTARGIDEPGLAQYRCKECYLPDLTCARCCVRRHRMHPFHRIEEWTGTHFVGVSLKSLGLKIQLNHTSMYCESPIACHASLLVLHTNGVHSISLQYCGCSRAIPIYQQLLRRRLYPASQLTVKTCATFELLEHLHRMALTTKATTYDFYRCLEISTSATGLNKPRTRYRALFRMILQWRHLKMLKRAARAHDTTGVVGTQPGQLAIVCPSCPHPGINIPDDWMNVSEERRFLYRVMICMDANFRLKNQKVSSYSQDPGLGTGWAYLVEARPYDEYVVSRATDKDISTCVGFQALAKSNTKFSVGLRYTGCNLTVCGRSEMIFPLGVGNLHKGERYANMDYIFASALRYISMLWILISYDICCQWYINLFKRIESDWPEDLKPGAGVIIEPAIPKLHEPAHRQKDHQLYSLNYIPGVGLSDCECPERVWAPHNHLANSTKTQGPGSRHDVLDDHFGFWNWLKYIDLGRTLARRYKAAVANRNLQVEGHRGLSESVGPELTSEWEKICTDWEAAPFPKKKTRNPYYLESVCLSEDEIKKEFADEEAAHLKAGGSFLHATTPSAFIMLGLELEETQRRLRRTIKTSGDTGTVHQQGSVKEQQNGLLTRIRAWEVLLPIYVPGLMQYQSDHPDPHPTPQNPEDMVLWLPSAIPDAHRSKICVPGLPSIEEKLRTAQCSDALDNLRKILVVKSRLIEFKNKNIRGQRDGTRSTTVIDRVHDQARRAAQKYRSARIAKLALTGPGEWENTFKELADGDIRGYQDSHRLRPRKGRLGTREDWQTEAPPTEPEDFVLYQEDRQRRDGTGETRRTLSWIWASENYMAGPEQEDENVLRVEWAKSRARSTRAKEEVMMLKEEMRRVLAYLEWKQGWWMDRMAPRPEVSTDLAEGLKAYAMYQAGIQFALAVKFRTLWKLPLQETPQPNANDNSENRPEDTNATVGDDDDDDDDEQSEEEIFDEDADFGTDD